MLLPILQTHSMFLVKSCGIGPAPHGTRSVQWIISCTSGHKSKRTATVIKTTPRACIGNILAGPMHILLGPLQEWTGASPAPELRALTTCTAAHSFPPRSALGCSWGNHEGERGAHGGCVIAANMLLSQAEAFKPEDHPGSKPSHPNRQPIPRVNRSQQVFLWAHTCMLRECSRASKLLYSIKT